MRTVVALLGAGGKMGCRLLDNLKDHSDYELLCVEVAEAGLARMRERGVAPTPRVEALRRAEVVILAVPDARIGAVGAEVVPRLAPGAIVMGLDPAAGYAGVLPPRSDVTYFAAHPCHPPLFMDETSPEAQSDWFGGRHARQSVVCALIQGPEEHYVVGERLAAAAFAPILHMHRVTLEQMALLEPGLVESSCAPLVWGMRAALDRAIALGVPEQAAWDFAMGHIRIQLAVLFDRAGFPFSDGAQLALEAAKARIYQPDWLDDVLSPEAVREQVREIVTG